MFVHMLKDFLREVPESLVHNVVINFARGGNIVRSNCWDEHVSMSQHACGRYLPEEAGLCAQVH